MFYRTNDDGNAVIFDDDGIATTSIDLSGHHDHDVYPIGSNRSVEWEHPEGIVLSLADADTLDITPEFPVDHCSEPSDDVNQYLPEPSDETIGELCIITTRNEAGEHFTEWAYHYDELEALGLINIYRPVHEATGIPYGQEEWSLEVTGDGQEMVDNHPELYPVG